MGGEDTQPVADTIATLLSAHCILFVVFFFFFLIIAHVIYSALAINKSVSIDFWKLHFSSQQVETELRGNMLLSHESHLYIQQGQCATVLLPRDAIKIIPALHNKSDHSFSVGGAELKFQHWIKASFSYENTKWIAKLETCTICSYCCSRVWRTLMN